MDIERLIVDRIEGDLAVCEKGGAFVNIPLSKIVGAVREGDILCGSGDGADYTVDAGDTAKRKDVISERFARIKARNK